MEITFQVLEGFDKGRIFRDLDSPVSIGREDGNTLRLNDERVSRYHAKVNRDRDNVILVDLDSTNGTRINGQVCSMRCLLPGDRIQIGKTTLLFGSPADIQKRLEDLCQPPTSDGAGQALNPANSKETEYSPKAGEARFPAPWGGGDSPGRGALEGFFPGQDQFRGGPGFFRIQRVASPAGKIVSLAGREAGGNVGFPALEPFPVNRRGGGDGWRWSQGIQDGFSIHAAIVGGSDGIGPVHIGLG